MNISYPLPFIANLPPAVEQAGLDCLRTAASLLIPGEVLYFAIYFHRRRYEKLYAVLTCLSLAAFGFSPILAPVSCGPIQCVQNFAVAIGIMKTLDLWARRKSFPRYNGKPPSDWFYALIVLTELRYESFTPNHIRAPKDEDKFSEPLQLCIHIAIFVVLQSLPQNHPTVLAFEVQLAIYIIWTTLQLLLRYKASPPLFGPLYLAESLSGYWSETWHNAFSSPCTSLAYWPLRYGLPKYGVPDVIARPIGVLGAFSLMSLFHIYALQPILDQEGTIRVGLFFFLNGVATVVETMIWGNKKHWLKTLLSWAFETSVATWAISGMSIPHGLWRIRWEEICDA
ncbi:hypothetical protein OIDMADRAFT_17670 [Oidiodendron maius Zn]|uniref:Wax synthase domain-containing protein n=1 Tax=Oidiodendron maius (strain Zn) TaxID=913774 RepID=A0A0C3HP14_OIDMZ|nr:hypothetical protein OIDMADRAFT_17670 [Oidiodendron maius Zn]